MFKPSPYQEAILNWIINGRGHGAVEAVAGSGKSSTLEFLAPQVNGKMVFLAFNSAIAKELAERLPKRSGLEARTLNSLGFAAVRKAYPSVKLETSKYRDLCLDYFNHPRVDIPRALLQRWDDGSLENDPLRELLSLVDMSRLNLVDPSDTEGLEEMICHYDIELDGEWEPHLLKALPLIIERGQSLASFKIDFVDQVWLPSVDPKVSTMKYDFVFVDEAQDLNKAQLNLVRKSLKRGGRLLAVGDRKQAIYGFGGADNRSFERIVETMKCERLPLSICYRCPKKVVLLAKQLVPQIEFHAGAKDGDILPISEEKMTTSVANGDLILCRTNAPLLETCFGLISAGVPARVRGRNIGQSLVSTAERIQKMRGFQWSQFASFCDSWEHRERLKILKKNKNNDEDPKLQALSDKVDCVRVIWARGDVRSIQDFKNMVNDVFSDKNAGVWLSSIHRAKGLEADRVFILRPELLPGPWVSPGKWQYEQELSLLYVAITRAKKQLFFVQDGKELNHSILNFDFLKES